MPNPRTVTVSFPRPLLEELDKVRGDIPRSRYLQRLFEKQLEV
jgi:metal-responsive CopG/Arc/MetJ family transcriptional regulator